MLTQADWGKPKAKPSVEVPQGHKLVQCGKCAGTGLYVMEVRNDKPWSATGTQCWDCGGTGWKILKPRRKRCSKCGMLAHVVDGEFIQHSFHLIKSGADHAELVVCNGK